MQSKEHWENVYSTKATDEVSWFQEHAERSLQLIRDAGVPYTASIIDVGGGASTLVDDLLSNGYERVTVLDLSGAALSTARARLGARASGVKWVETNVIEAKLPAHEFDVWHDRAVFHFLNTAAERHALCADGSARRKAWRPRHRGNFRRRWPNQMQRASFNALRSK